MELDDLFGLGDLVEEAKITDRQNEVLDLVERLTKASHDYYNGSPSMSDAEYDGLEDRLRDLDPDNDFFTQVGAPVVKSPWEKVRHRAPMGSLNKAQSTDDLVQWSRDCEADIRQGTGVRALRYLVSDKCDGISLSLWYDDGKLTRALTRGDGIVGEDITRNVIKMKGVVHEIKGFTGELRAEIVLLHEDWQKHFPDYANPRNAASGVAKRLDGVGSEHLTVLHYQMIRRGGKPILFKGIEFRALSKLGCAVPSWYEFDTAEEVLTLYQEYLDVARAALNYDIDGLVVEFDDREVYEALGERNHRPRGAIAFKFPHEEKPSTLLDIEWQVGSTGRVTPVAKFEPVRLAGANVRQASLYNISYIDSLGGLTAGSRVLVSRRNDVIPRVEKLIQRGAGVALEAPSNCPACDGPLVMDGEFLVCRNDEECPKQVTGGIKRWLRALGLLGWGDEIIVALCEAGLVSSPADLYRLDAETFSEVQMSGRRVGSTADKLITDLHAAKEVPLHVFVGSLGIPMCAKSVCKTIFDSGFDTLDKMRSATKRQVAALPGLGEAKAVSFVDGLAARAATIDALLDAGIAIKAPSDGPLKGMTVCMTGFRDPDMERAIEDAGGTMKSGVGKTLSILVAADPKSTSGKAKKARDYGVTIISPDEMWGRLGRP